MKKEYQLTLHALSINQMSNKFDKVSGVILAGGKNSRYDGKDKSFIKFKGKYFIDRILEVYQKLFKEIIIISNRPQSYNNYENIILNSDKFKEMGPLAGLHSAMLVCNNPYFFVLSCDMPFPNKNFIKLIIENNNNYDALIPKHNTKIEPLHALYKANKTELLEEHIIKAEKLSIRSYLNKINTKYFEVEEKDETLKSFMNINSEEEYNQNLSTI